MFEIFNDTLTNDVVSFEQPGPGIQLASRNYSWVNRKIPFATGYV